jgi:Family of unknown function (DUF5715)
MGTERVVGEQINAANIPGSSGRISQPPLVLPDSSLALYRAAVDDLVREVSEHQQASEMAAVEKIASRWLQEPEIRMLLSHLDGGADTRAAALIGEIRGYQPNGHSSAIDVATFIRILLLSQIDAAWWSGTTPFAYDADVLGSAELVDLEPLQSARLLKFGYRAQPAGLPGRARDWLQHRFLPAFRPRVAGLRLTYSRPVVIAMVNQIAHDFAAAMPTRTPRIWVNSMVRSLEHQHRLRSLGYAAVLPSAHCAGYACDLESSWLRPFDPDNVLPRLLLERQEAGQINVIDEGRTWHLCINPNACDGLRATYDAQLRTQ